MIRLEFKVPGPPFPDKEFLVKVREAAWDEVKRLPREQWKCWPAKKAICDIRVCQPPGFKAEPVALARVLKKALESVVIRPGGGRFTTTYVKKASKKGYVEIFIIGDFCP